MRWQVDLKSKNVFITGASKGLGKEIANLFTEHGAKVVATSKSGTNNTLECDIRYTYQIKQALGLFEPDIVVCNAGIYGPIGPTEEVNMYAWEDAIETNLIGTFKVCREVIPNLKKKKKGKIIILSGGGATKPMPNFSAYAASKAAVVRFGETIAEELRDYNIDVNMVAPGSMNTQFMEQTINAGPERAGKEFYEAMVKQKEEGGASIRNAAELCLFLASEKSDGITGKLISAVWDDWKNMTKYNTTGEQYTLRRVNKQ